MSNPLNLRPLQFHQNLAAQFLFATIGVSHGFADPDLDAALDQIAPEYRKWASVCVVKDGPDGKPQFTWTDYRDTGNRTDFWPASTIKLYTAVAALELLHERNLPLDTIVTFEHRDADGTWVFDAARSVREMLHTVFQRSSNSDYTLLLRMVGIDRINTNFLIPERGFPSSALMRGYVLGRPFEYVREEPQRITLRPLDGSRTETYEHTWSGRSYSEERGATIISAKTGNVTSPRELGECIRRILFHEHLPENERYRLSDEQVEFLRRGGKGLIGLENKQRESGPSAWTNGVEKVFPNARFFHKCGEITSYALEVAAVDDRAHSGVYFILVPAIQAGSSAKPIPGDKLIGQMSRAIAEWVRARHTSPQPASDSTPPGQ